MAVNLSKSEVNHLRRLVAWVRCDVGQSPVELMETVRKIAPAIGEPSEYAKNALVKMHTDSVAVPKYIRAAIKALEKTLKDEGEITDGEVMKNRLDVL